MQGGGPDETVARLDAHGEHNRIIFISYSYLFSFSFLSFGEDNDTIHFLCSLMSSSIKARSYQVYRAMVMNCSMLATYDQAKEVQHHCNTITVICNPEAITCNTITVTLLH
jgi:hypothetical protein